MKNPVNCRVFFIFSEVDKMTTFTSWDTELYNSKEGNFCGRIMIFLS